MSKSPAATDPAFLSARELLAAFRSRTLSPVEALDAVLARLAADNPTLNAFQVAVPAKVVLGLLLVGTSMPFVAGWLGTQLQEDVRSALQSLRIA